MMFNFEQINSIYIEVCNIEKCELITNGSTIRIIQFLCGISTAMFWDCSILLFGNINFVSK